MKTVFSRISNQVFYFDKTGKIEKTQSIRKGEVAFANKAVIKAITPDPKVRGWKYENGKIVIV